MASIKFLIQSDREDKPIPIYVRVRDTNLDIRIKTGLSIYKRYWSSEKQTASGKPKDEHLKQAINLVKQRLPECRAKIERELNRLNPHEDISTQWFKDIIHPPKNKAIPDSLIGYFDYYIDKRRGDTHNPISYRTEQKLNVVKNLLLRYQGTKRSIMIRDINEGFGEDFSNYCKAEGYAPNTIARTLKSIKTICRHARKKGIDTHRELDDIKPTIKEVHHIHLSFDELGTISLANMPQPYLDNARDWLIISCYTGQRISDFMRFDKSMLRTEKNRAGNPVRLIEFKQVKTGRKLAIPVHPKVDEVLNKRGGSFPKPISDQRYNDYIKEVCKQAGLTHKVQGSRKNPVTIRKETGMFEKWELVTSHIGRRSFATNFYGQIPTSLLKAATGHSTEKMFLEYIGKSDAEQAKQLADYF